MLSTLLTRRHPLPKDHDLDDPSESLLDDVKNKLHFYIKTVTNLRHKHHDVHHGRKEGIHEVYTKLMNGLKLLQLHMGFISNVINAKSEEEVVKIKKDYRIISASYDSIIKSSDVSLVPTDQILSIPVKNILKDSEKIIEKLFSEQSQSVNEGQEDSDEFAKIKITTAKLEAIIEYLPGIVTIPKDNVFYHSRSSSVWQKLYKDTEFRRVVSSEEQQSIQEFCTLLILANAFVYTTQQLQEKMDNKTFGRIVGTISGLYYSAQKEKAHIRASLLFAEPKMESAFDVWNLLDKKFLRELYKLRLPPIDYDKKIYIPRLFPEINKDTILKEFQENTLNILNKKPFVLPSITEKREEILKTLFIKNDDRVRVRILSPWPLGLTGNPIEKAKVILGNLKNKFPFIDISKSNFKENFNGVVIHIHGGGFVSMSSASHRNYLIRWAKSLNMIIYSIDYRLAPTNPYPAALDDVWQAYNWLVNYSESVLGIPMDRVVLTGDSAGGNLVMALTLRLIKEGGKIPNGCLLSYPALNLFPKKTVPSYFLALNDIILSYNVLKLCLKAYIPEEFHPEADPFLSPICASDELLSRLPAIRIVTGTNDPLHDDNWRMVQRLQGLGKDIKMTVYEGLPHGFLGADDFIGYEMLIAETVGRIRELFYSVDQKK